MSLAFLVRVMAVFVRLGLGFLVVMADGLPPEGADLPAEILFCCDGRIPHVLVHQGLESRCVMGEESRKWE